MRNRNLLAAEIEANRVRLRESVRAGRGIQFNRKETALVSALVALALERCDVSAVNHELTEQEDDDRREI